VSAFRECDGVIQIVRQIGGMNEDAQANPVESVVLENLKHRLGHAILLEHDALLLGAGQERHVRADGELLRR
jgi:hypothetical protein